MPSSMPSSNLSSSPIGVFDSGIGGLSVLRALRAELPREDFVYLADTGFAPYGERGDAHVIARSRAIAAFLRERGADLLALLRDDNSHFHVCGLKGMEEGVVMALRDIAQEAGLSWEVLGATLQREGRLHLETY